MHQRNEEALALRREEVKGERLLSFIIRKAGEFSSEGVEHIPPYGNFGVEVCRGVAIKRGHL